ncbi:glycosyltransferase family protein [Algoriphagus mannitolivorans]|uniref:glycosyltransferase family protein n=1 Tax=Algoriphagus mannitolivorans TaxID=226504 RepID=UPI000A0678FD|nr:glycosyltransferase family protein [Algoriphagus mannitolivorans]
MKFLFIVQGEGRGHMTQAIAFYHLLRSQGHEVCGVIVGKSKRREIPDFFSREIKAPIHLVDSPNFVADKKQKKILLGKTIRKNALQTPTFWKSLKTIHQVVESRNPDVILNFYDLLGGLYNFLFRPSSRFWVIGHQYLIYHPDFLFAKGKPWDKFLFQLNTHLTALGSDEVLALSFLPKIKLINPKVRVVPPLLRKEVKKLEVKSEDFYLAYMVNPGYGEEILAFAKSNPLVKIKAYWDKKSAKPIENPLPNLSFHRVNDQTFLQDMAACKGLACTAGFESVCEAMYLRKPVLMIPVAGQYEQACNALDGEASGAGIASSSFDFSLLEKVEKKDTEASFQFHQWVDSWLSILSELIVSTEQESGVKNPDEEFDSSPVFG